MCILAKKKLRLYKGIIHIKNLFWFILTDESVFMPETCGPGCETHFPKLISLKSSCLYFCYSQFRIYNAINPNSK